MKTLLDIAKESADWFPPLKAALGGVSAVVKHYEVPIQSTPSSTPDASGVAIRRCQGETRGPHSAAGSVQTKHHDHDR